MTPTVATILTIITLVGLANAYKITAENATHITNGSFYPATVVKARDQLVYVSFPRVNSDTSIKLDWIQRSCEILLPRISYMSTSAESLSNGKVVVALVQDKPSKRAKSVSVDFYVVDVKNNCRFKKFVAQLGDTILSSYKPFLIVPYNDKFDIFAKSLLHCEPKNSICMIRYSEQGEQLGTRNFDFDTAENSFDLEIIHPLDEFDPSNGYVYISAHRSSLRILDSKLATIKASKIPGYLVSHSVVNGDIGICSHTYDVEEKTECLKMDSRMKIKTRVALTESSYFGAKRLYNLLDGSSLIVSLSRGPVNGLVKRLATDGRLGEANLFEFECTSPTTDPQDYFVELEPGLYCFSFVCTNGLITHCTGLPSLDRLPTYLT